MYFYELLNECGKDELTEEFMKLCSDSPLPEDTRKRFLSFCEHIGTLEPDKTEDYILHSEKMTDEEGEYYSVNVVELKDGKKYSIMICPWDEILGVPVCEEEVNEQGKVIFAANVLWEMTYLGFDEETVAKNIESLQAQE